MGDKLCIVCGKPVTGLKAVKVKEDPILGFIRSVKRALKIAQENELYVCEGDLKVHQQRRSEFQKSMILFSIVASVVVIAVIAGAVLSGTLNLAALFASFLIAVMLVIFSMIIKYTPATEGTEPVLVMAREESAGIGRPPAKAAGKRPAKGKKGVR